MTTKAISQSSPASNESAHNKLISPDNYIMDNAASQKKTNQSFHASNRPSNHDSCGYFFDDGSYDLLKIPDYSTHCEDGNFIERFFFPIVMPWRYTDKIEVPQNIYCLNNVKLNIPNTSDDIIGVGMLFLDNSLCYWDGLFSIHDDGEKDIENSMIVGNNLFESATKQYRGGEPSPWQGRFDIHQIVNLELDDIRNLCISLTFENEEHQRLCVRFGFSNNAEAENFYSWVEHAMSDLNSNNIAVESTKPMKRKSKKKKDNRRTSLSFDTMIDILGDETIKTERGEAIEQRDTICSDTVEHNHKNEILNVDNDVAERVTIDNEHHSHGRLNNKKVESKNMNNRYDMPVNVSSDALFDIVRSFARSPERLGFAARDEIHKKYSYDLSLTKTPSKERIERSPPRPRNYKPTQEMLTRLQMRKMFKTMTENDKTENSNVQEATQVTILKPKNSQESIRYICKKTQRELEPNEYAQRYMEVIKRNSRPIIQSEQSKESGVRNRERKKEIVNPMVEPSYISTGDNQTFDFEKEILEAERCLHDEFDRAISSFLEKRSQLEKTRDANMKFQELHLQRETNENKSIKKYHSSTVREKLWVRRQSILPDGLKCLIGDNSEDSPIVPESKKVAVTSPQLTRVLWSTKNSLA